MTFSDVLNKTIAFGLPQTIDTNDGGGGGGGGGNLVPRPSVPQLRTDYITAAWKE